jgi:ABC-type hemin transport system ATPase subunit
MPSGSPRSSRPSDWQTASTTGPRSCPEYGQTVVMVTHDPVAAAYADRVVFLADGLLVDEMLMPTAEKVLDRMKRFDGAA